MNRTYKTVWNAKKGQLVVANETQKAKGKTGKTLTVLAVAAAALIGTVAQAAYVEQGKIGDVTSWESAEYTKVWGLKALKASSAYAKGFYGQGVKIGVMDSGAFLQKNPDLAGDRFHAVEATGTYGQSGYRYPQYLPQTDDESKHGAYKEGDSFVANGQYEFGTNDSHGTQVTGTIGASRDGNGMHGVAWGSDVYVANTGGNDNTNYGPFGDYNFFKAGYDALVDAGVKIINNSFGTNLKQYSKDESGKVTMEPYYTSGVPLTDAKEVEYEYYLFKQMYGDKKSAVDAAWDAIKGKDVIQVFTSGNNNRANPYHRALYPYFHPEAEGQWIAISGLRQQDATDDPNNYKIESKFNEAGFAKWWTLAGPGQNGYTTAVDPNTGKLTAAKGKYEEGYGSFSGTSMAAPFISGAFGVLASRYEDMTAEQVRLVLLTTASHTNADGSTIEGWENATSYEEFSSGTNVNTTEPVPEGEVSNRLGWGVPDLDKGMYGLGQMFGHFDYNLKAGHTDVWANDISEVALKQREREDLEWLKSVTEDGTVDGKVVVSDNADDYKLDNDKYIAGIDKKEISLEDAKKWRLEYYEARAKDIRDKIAKHWYDGHLTKRGDGTLVLTGSNTWTGGTTVEAGTLLGYTESFGDAAVEVNGGKFGLLTSFNHDLNKEGHETSTADRFANINVNKGGTLLLTEGHDAEAGDVAFKEGAKIAVKADDLKSVYQGEDATVTLSAASITGLDLAKADDTLAFFKTSFEAGTPETRAPGSTITATLTRNDDVSMSSIATTANGRAIGAALEAVGEGELFDAILSGTTDQVAATYDSLGSDAFLNAQNASIVNTLTMTRAIQDQATGIGQGRAIDFADGTGRLWATGVGSWGSVDYGQTSIDNDFYVGFIGGEVKVADSSKVGVFFGAGTSEFKGGSHGKIKSNDVHFGIYGVSNIADLVAANYGITYTKQDRDMSRTLAFGSQIGANATSGNADILQLFAEGAYTGFNTAQYSVEPYVGFNWLNVKADNFAETVGNTTFTTNNKTQNLQVTTLGVRGAVPFTVGNVAMTVKGNAGWSHFFGDTEAKATMGLGNSGFTTIKGGELKDQANIGLGIEAQLTKSATFGFSYTGTYDGDVTASGVSANLRIAF